MKAHDSRITKRTRTSRNTKKLQPDKKHKYGRSQGRVRRSCLYMRTFYLQGAPECLKALVVRKVVPSPLEEVKTFSAPNRHKQSQDSVSERHWERAKDTIPGGGGGATFSSATGGAAGEEGSFGAAGSGT